MGEHAKWLANGRRRPVKSRGNQPGYWGKKQVQRVKRRSQKGPLVYEDDGGESAQSVSRPFRAS